MSALPDIQDQPDARGVALDAVGIAGVRVPTTFDDGGTVQAGFATFDFSVTLPEERRGTHMSRMVELIHDELNVLAPQDLPRVLKTAAQRMEVDSLTISASMALGFEVVSPASGKRSFQPADIVIAAGVEPHKVSVSTQLTTQVTSLCPCSKAISDYGAHNQRSDVTIAVSAHGDAPYPCSVADLFARARNVGSCAIFPLIKRPDERAITMIAFDRPAFVEDMARDLSVQLRAAGLAHSISIRNFESIHSHDAVAQVSWAPVD